MLDSDMDKRHGETCVSLMVPPDPGMLDNFEPNSRLAIPCDDRAAIGCVWTSLKVGHTFAALNMRAATSGMSRAFDQSVSIRSVIASIAEVGGARLAALDREEGELICIWPRPAMLVGWWAYSVTQEDAIDVYAARLLGGLDP